MEWPILIDVWIVDPARRRELVELISDNLRQLVVQRTGFVSAQIYETMDGGTVLVNVRMRTARDRRELTDSVDVQRAYRLARRIASSHASNYRLVESFGDGLAPEDPEVIDPREGQMHTDLARGNVETHAAREE